MPESTFRHMTAEHLGPTATAGDLAYFQAACRRLVERDGLTEQEATDAVWRDGDWYRRVAEILTEA